MGMSKELKTEVNSEGLGVGLSGLMGHIGEKHNEGGAVTYPRRINGFFNKDTNRWEGGKIKTAAYKMPKRKFIGWNKELEQELASIIFSELKPK